MSAEGADLDRGTDRIAHAALIGGASGIVLAGHVGGPMASWTWVIGVLLIAGVWRLRTRRTAVLGLTVVGAVLMGFAMQHRATAAIDFPDADRYAGWVTLIDDPRPSGPVGVRATVRLGGRRLAATAHAGAAGRLDDGAAGEQLRVIGTVRPVSSDDWRSLHRHVVGRLTVDEVLERRPGSPVASAANVVRRTLTSGAESLGRDRRPVFLGMVIGDDRGQSPVTADDFRASGLGHLLVVSGQNVAFVLAVAMPVAGRLRPGGRALVLLAVIALFAVVTRFEPSVLRASAMAGVGVGAAALGRPVDGRAALSWACAGLLMVDPFLLHVLAFQLSAAATGGIVWFGGPLAARLPGPRWLTIPVSTTLAAQVAVAPLLLAVFGPMPLASLPANLLAGPVAGFVMIWGCTGGVLAGVATAVGLPAVADAIHLPTRLMLWWVETVAASTAAAPAATIGSVGIATLAVAVGAAVWRHQLVPIGIVAAVVIAIGSVVRSPSPEPGTTIDASGVTIVHRDGRTAAILNDPWSAQNVLETLRRRGIRTLDLVVAVDGDRADADTSLALRERFGPVPIAAPPLHRVPHARVVQRGQLISVGALQLRVEEVDPRLELTLLPRAGDG